MERMAYISHKPMSDEKIKLDFNPNYTLWHGSNPVSCI